MSERAKQIALKIIEDVWPNSFTDSWIDYKITQSVEKHMLRPHQARDRYGRIWEAMSDGLYRPMVQGVTEDKIEEFADSFYEKMAENGEIVRLKERIAELESANARTERLQKKVDGYGQEIIDTKIHVDDLQGRLAEERSISAMRSSQIAELEKQLAAAKAEPAKPQPEAIWQLISEDSWAYGVPIRGAVRKCRANVYFNGRDWIWYLDGSSIRGEAAYFSEAIDASEEAMGIK